MDQPSLLEAKPYFSHEEIDIRALILALYKQWRLITTIITVITLLAVGIVLFWPRIYEVKSIISPPELEDVKELSRNSVTPYSLDDVYAEYFNKLTQIDVARSYFEKTEFYKVITKKTPDAVFSVEDIDHAFALFRAFFRIEKIRLDYLELKKDEKTPLGKVSVILETPHPEAAVEFINGFIQYVEQQALQKFYNDQLALKQLKKEKLENEIKSLKEKTRAIRETEIAVLVEQNDTKIRSLEDEIKARVAEAGFKREARIAQLKEALVIAKTLGITEPRSLDDFKPAAEIKSQIAISTHLNNSDSRPLYLLGSQFLSAEIEQLSQREQDEYFVPGLGELKKELALIKNNRHIEALKQREDDYLFIKELPEIHNQLAALELVSLDFNDVKLLTWEQKAFVPLRAVSPNKRLVVSAAFAMGLMVALGVALLRVFLRDDKKSISESALFEEERIHHALQKPDPSTVRNTSRSEKVRASSG